MAFRQSLSSCYLFSSFAWACLSWVRTAKPVAVWCISGISVSMRPVALHTTSRRAKFPRLLAHCCCELGILTRTRRSSVLLVVVVTIGLLRDAGADVAVTSAQLFGSSVLLPWMVFVRHSGILWKSFLIVSFWLSSVCSIMSSMALASLVRPSVTAVSSEMRGTRGPCLAWRELESPFSCPW